VEKIEQAAARQQILTTPWDSDLGHDQGQCFIAGLH